MVRAAMTLINSSPSTYLQKRKLAPPFVGPVQLAGFIIGIVISGAFTGWNTGLSFGFVNMAIAVGLATIMYLTLVLSCCEMCSALPFASGPAAFAQAALNSGFGALTGGVYATSYTLLSATVLVSLGNFITASLPAGAQVIPSAVYWLPLAAIALALNSRPRLLFRAAIVLSCYSCLLLVAYLGVAFLILPTQRNFSPNAVDGRTDVYYDEGEGRATIDTSQLSLRGIIAAFPFACWLYVGIESFPTASEEARKIFRTAPTAVLYSAFFLAFFATTLLTTAPQVSGNLAELFVASSLQAAANAMSVPSIDPSALHNHIADFSHSNHPLLDNALNLLCSRYPTSNLPEWCQPSASASSTPSASFFHRGHPLITLLVLTTLLPPLFLSLITGTYAASRHIYTLSRAGVLPTRISKTSPHGAPNYATVITLACGMAIAGSIELLSYSNMGGKLFATLASARLGVGGTGDAANPHIVPFETPVASDGSTPTVQAGFFCPAGDAETSLAILQVSAWLACVSYVLEFGSYILLRLRVAQLPRPFVSPIGMWGAGLGLVLALVFGVVGPLFVDSFFYGVLLACVTVWGVLATAYWVFVAKARMADSPEKIFVRLQIQLLYGRRAPGPVASHPPGGDQPPPGDQAAGEDALGQDRLLSGNARGRDPGTRTVLLSPRPDSHTLPAGGNRPQRGGESRTPRRHRRQPGSGGVATLRVHDHSMPTVAVHSQTQALPMTPPMCTPAVPYYPSTSTLHDQQRPQGSGRWDWASMLRLPGFLRYGSAWSYRAAGGDQHDNAQNGDGVSLTTTDMASYQVRQDWNAQRTRTVSHGSQMDTHDDDDDDYTDDLERVLALPAAAPAALSPDPPLTRRDDPAIRRLTTSSDAFVSRDSGVTDLSAATRGLPSVWRTSSSETAEASDNDNGSK